MLSALPIFKVQYTKKGDFGQLRERKSKICPRFAGSWKLSNYPGQ